MSQMLSMMKPLSHDAEYPSEFFVDDLEYLPRTIYHMIRRTLWPIKGHSSAAKLEGAMKTLVFYILNGITFNAHDFFIRQFAAFGSCWDLAFGICFLRHFGEADNQVHKVHLERAGQQAQ